MSPHEPGITIDNRVMVPRAALDHDGYRAWVKSDAYPERLRTTFVAGQVLVDMTPESIEAHNKLKTAVTEALSAFVRARDLGELSSDGALLTNEEAGLSCEPDLTFVAWNTSERGGVRLVERVGGTDYIEIVGSPDLVVEIVSDSSVKKDTRLLRDAYARGGVSEYWLIDARGTEIRFDILSNVDHAFGQAIGSSVAQQSLVLGGWWHLTRERNRLGRFTYRLDHRS